MYIYIYIYIYVFKIWGFLALLNWMPKLNEWINKITCQKKKLSLTYMYLYINIYPYHGGLIAITKLPAYSSCAITLNLNYFAFRKWHKLVSGLNLIKLQRILILNLQNFLAFGFQKHKYIWRSVSRKERKHYIVWSLNLVTPFTL
jgi:hypothetical protein